MKIANNMKKKTIATESDWQEPITDRTQLDIQFARNVISEAKQIGRWPVDEDNKPIYLKGCLNYMDLNRIEKNIVWLVKRIKELTNIDVNIQKPITTWTVVDVFTFDDFIRILKNLKKIHTSMDLELDIGEENLDVLKPEDVKIDFMMINLIEKLQYRLYDLLTRVEKINIYSGSFSDEELDIQIRAGQKDILPISSLVKQKLKEKRNENKVPKKNN